MGSPSTAVKPIVLATLRPADIAHMLAPLPRCAASTFAAASKIAVWVVPANEELMIARHTLAMLEDA
jgi:acetate kinase